MKNVLVFLFMLITFSAFSQGGLLKPRYIGWPVDSFQNLTLKWNPSTFKAEWVVDGAGGDSTTFVGDSVCIVNMGVETCISLDSVYFTDTSFCYIQLPDTTCIDWNSSNGNIYNISGTLTGHRTLQQGSYSLQFSRSNNTLYGSTYWSQPGLWPIMSLSGGLVPNDASPTLSIASNGSDGDQYQLFNGPTGADYSIGVSRSASLNPFTIAEGEDLGGAAGRPMMQFYGVGDSIVMVNDVLAGGSLLRLRANTTAAVSNTQKGLEVFLRGANATSGQTTYAGYFNNIHTGTGATNYGIYSNASGGGSFNYGVYALGSYRGVYGGSSGASGIGVYGEATSSGTGVLGTSTSGAAVLGVSNASGYAIQGISTGTQTVMHLQQNSTSTNTVTSIATLNRVVSGGVGADGVGGKLDWTIENSSGASFQSASIDLKLTTANSATFTTQMIINGTNSASATEILYLEGDKRVRFNGRAEEQQGADVASAAGFITLGYDGNTFEITGTNAITGISNIGWQNGSEVTLFFTSTASLTDGTANSGTDIGMELNGNANFTGSADDSVTLVLSEIGGTQRWREKCRSVN